MRQLILLTLFTIIISCKSTQKAAKIDQSNPAAVAEAVLNYYKSKSLFQHCSQLNRILQKLFIWPKSLLLPDRRLPKGLDSAKVTFNWISLERTN